MVKDIYVGNSGSPAYLTVVGNTLFFAATDGTNGTELWKSDGTSSGTALVDGTYLRQFIERPLNLAAVERKLLFSATNGVVGRELWTSDGTSSGTTLGPTSVPERPTRGSAQTRW